MLNDYTKDDAFPGGFIKAANLPEAKTFTIAAAEMELLKSPTGVSERKLVLSFEGYSQKLVVNRTNFDSIARLHGPSTRTWIGKEITLYPTTASVRGKETPCVRVRAAS